MPNAPTHDLITLVTAAGADVAYFHMTPHPSTMLAALFTASYIFAGYACAGDLDLNSTEYRRWGVFRIFWWPYQKLIRHRSRLSHGLILGGVLRLVYLFAVVSLLIWGVACLASLYFKAVNPRSVTQHDLLSLDAFLRLHPRETVAALLGFILAGTVHSLSDITVTWVKRHT